MHHLFLKEVDVNMVSDRPPEHSVQSLRQMAWKRPPRSSCSHWWKQDPRDPRPVAAQPDGAWGSPRASAAASQALGRPSRAPGDRLQPRSDHSDTCTRRVSGSSGTLADLRARQAEAEGPSSRTSGGLSPPSVGFWRCVGPMLHLTVSARRPFGTSVLH